MSDTHRTRFECADPILRVENMPAAVRYYVDVLGFEQASWGDDNFTCVSRDRAGIYLSKGDQGHTGMGLDWCRGRRETLRGAQGQRRQDSTGADELSLGP